MSPARGASSGGAVAAFGDVPEWVGQSIAQALEQIGNLSDESSTARVVCIGSGAPGLEVALSRCAPSDEIALVSRDVVPVAARAAHANVTLWLATGEDPERWRARWARVARAWIADRLWRGRRGEPSAPLERLRRAYACRLPCRLAEIDDAAEGSGARGQEDVRLLVHKLAGSAGSYGFEDLGEAARRLEALADPTAPPGTRGAAWISAREELGDCAHRATGDLIDEALALRQSTE